MSIRQRLLHGNDIGGGFDLGWVEMLELNTIIAPKGAEEKMNELIRDFSKGKVKVFEREYIGVDPNDPERVFASETVTVKTGNTPRPHFIMS